MSLFFNKNLSRFALCMVFSLSLCACSMMEDTAPAPDYPNFGMVPNAGSALARQIDRQLSGGFGKPDGGGVSGFTLAVTVPADLNDLEKSSPLARQVAEEMARWFVQAGYSVQEVRMASNLYIDKTNGELMLSRNTAMLRGLGNNVMGVLVGTYTTSQNSVRFNVRVVQAGGNEVLGMATVTVPLNSDVSHLLVNEAPEKGIQPSVNTRLTLPNSSKP